MRKRRSLRSWFTARSAAFLSLALLAMAASALAATQFREEDPTASRTSRLAPLPPGPPNAPQATAIVRRIALEEMASGAGTVFVGRVEEVGGSEIVTPATQDGPDGGAQMNIEPLTAHRTRFLVTRAFRGSFQTGDRVDITQLDNDTAITWRTGDQYLVFAHRVELGTTRTSRLVPFGYSQAAYELINDVTARNESNGRVDLTQLTNLLGGK